MLEADAAAREDVPAVSGDIYPCYGDVKARFDNASKKILDDFEEDYRQLHRKDEISEEPV